MNERFCIFISLGQVIVIVIARRHSCTVPLHVSACLFVFFNPLLVYFLHLPSGLLIWFAITMLGQLVGTGIYYRIWYTFIIIYPPSAG